MALPAVVVIIASGVTCPVHSFNFMMRSLHAAVAPGLSVGASV